MQLRARRTGLSRRPREVDSTARAFVVVPVPASLPCGGPSARRWNSLGSGGANWLASSADARSDILASRRPVDARLLAGLVETNGGRSNTVSSRPLAW